MSGSAASETAGQGARNNRADGDGDEVDGDARRESAWQPAQQAGVAVVDQLADRSLPPEDEESHAEDL
ncbi:hypothetical protein ACFT4A_30935 [Streptomyces sp. NPDC057099]|uniref:hypothetical protein n=1 Tax=Streptomyces sp. NPDC057099 TaxID=3346019 RepID=UPI00364092F9